MSKPRVFFFYHYIQITIFAVGFINICNSRLRGEDYILKIVVSNIKNARNSETYIIHYTKRDHLFICLIQKTLKILYEEYKPIYLHYMNQFNIILK